MLLEGVKAATLSFKLNQLVLQELLHVILDRRLSIRTMAPRGPPAGTYEAMRFAGAITRPMRFGCSGTVTRRSCLNPG